MTQNPHDASEPAIPPPGAAGSGRFPLPAVLASLFGLIALYWDAIRTRFLNDDYLFLEDAARHKLLDSLRHLGPLGNYYRPLSRQIYFHLLAPIAAGRPLVFHLVNFAVFLAALALLADLLRRLLPRTGVMAGVLYFALLPFQRVNLMWVSCAQDLLALFFVLGAMALHRRGHRWGALLSYAAALTSKETALAMPFGIAGWELAVERRTLGGAARRTAPYAVLAAAWAAVVFAMRAHHAAAAPLDFAPGGFAAGIAHLGQSLIGLDHPGGLARSLAAHGPALVPLVLLGGLGYAYAPPTRTESPGALPVARGRVIAFALLCAVAFALPVGPVAYGWSSYYYTLSAAGAAALFGLLFARGDRWTWLALVAGLLWWHAGSAGSPAFSVAERRWTWTSHLTTYYFQRAAALTDSISRQLRRVEPHPASGTRFYFATLPSWAGFQMGNGAQVRALYRDTTLASYFYSQFSDSTADRAPCRFLFWDGLELVPLYRRDPDPWFQVGSDLLLLERPAGARDAFRRGLESGGNRMDLLYWLGWAELMTGNRAAAESNWLAFGAADDSLRWRAHLRAAHNAVVDGDTVNARRHLVMAIQYGIGRREAHAVLGMLLMRDPHPITTKYALMELEVAAWLDPRDWDTRRALALGLHKVRLDQVADQELRALVHDFPALARDPEIERAMRELGGTERTDVVEMGSR